MTVEHPSVVDVVSLSRETHEVVLTVSDHLDWSPETQHLPTLLTKVAAYVSFVQSGEIGEKFPRSIGRAVRVDVAFVHAPPQEICEAELAELAEVLAGAEIAFSWRVLDAG